ncbi:CIR protein [Plasmodium chabaudi chabaudi]|uniref:CIR protein n=1 Tax=Plasmodium chabaudi chabaudi TaxID=31271 RepID=A0A1D3LG25_PLACU|nr:CIR protein [Plasmodium chabaudi chabaudi]
MNPMRAMPKTNQTLKEVNKLIQGVTQEIKRIFKAIQAAIPQFQVLIKEVDQEMDLLAHKMIGSGDGSVGGQDTIDSVSGIPDLSVTSSTRDIPTTSPFGMNLNVATYLVNAIASFETIKKRIAEATDTIKNLYSTSLSNLETAYDKSSSFLKDIIDNISSQPEKAGTSAKSGNNQYGSKDTGDGLPTFNGTSKSQKDLPQTSSGTSHISLPPQNPKEQTNTSQLFQDPFGNRNFNQTDQVGSQKSLTSPVIKPENSVTKVKGSETTGIGDIYVFKEYKQIGISIIVLLIPITLAIAYKYLSFGWRKELKRKKKHEKGYKLNWRKKIDANNYKIS